MFISNPVYLVLHPNDLIKLWLKCRIEAIIYHIETFYGSLSILQNKLPSILELYSYHNTIPILYLS